MSTEVPADLATKLTRPRRLSDEHAARYGAYLAEELARYPHSLFDLIPRFEIFDEAEADATPIGARYFDDINTVVLTPRPDFRGNVHRCIAAALLHKRPEAAAKLIHSWEITESSADSGLLYSVGALNGTGQIAALLAACVLNRPTLARLAAVDEGFGARWNACTKFLGDLVGDTFPWPNLPASPRYAYLLAVQGDYPSWTILPGELVISAAPDDIGEGYAIEPLTTRDASSLPRVATLDLWPLPEYVLSETLTRIDYVHDIRSADCDIAGLASGRAGDGARIIVEMDGRRSILCHELGHALHFRFHDLFPETRWKAASGNAYQAGSLAYIKSGANEPDYSPRLLERGFISGYSTSEFAEDVAEIAGALFSGDVRLWAAMPDFGTLATKVALMIEFLHHIDPVFNRRYFDELQQQRVREEVRWAS